ncbi:MAG: chorismate lyase [Methylococcus sp.]|nr:chorismate lyase [Methylococcus sp.]
MNPRSELFCSTPDYYGARRRTSFVIPRALQSWVFESGSLTRRLQAEYGDAFGVRVIRQRFAHPFPDEARLLGLRSGRRALVREVALLSGDRPLILARSVLPARTLRGAGRRLARLGNRPLGGILFASRSLRRSGFEVAKAGAETWLPGIRKEFGLSSPVWGRRSVYALSRRSLLVAEFFLPGLILDEESA